MITELDFRPSELIIKYLKQDLSPVESEQLQNWRDSSETNNLLFQEITNPETLSQSLQIFYNIEQGKEKAHKNILSRLWKNGDQEIVSLP